MAINENRSSVYSAISELSKKGGMRGDENRIREALSMYTDSADQIAYHLSSVRFCFNYATFYEMIHDRLAGMNGDHDGFGAPAYAILNLVSEISKNAKVVFLDDEKAQMVSSVAELKTSATALMKELTDLADRFTLYEYVINRMEYRFKEQHVLDDYSDDNFKNLLLQFITAGSNDNGSDHTREQATKVTAVIEQLPLRMTKQRFFSILSDSYSVYAGSSRQTLCDLDDMIRTSSAMGPLKEESAFLFAVECLEDLAAFCADDSLKNDATEFIKIAAKMQEGFSYINDQTDLLLLAQELVNDLYVCALAAETNDFSVSDEQADKKVISLIEKENEMVSVLMEKGILKAEEADLSDIFEGFEEIMGAQESLMTLFDKSISVREEFVSVYKESIETDEALNKAFDRLSKYEKLISSSLYADLESNPDEDLLADSDFINEKFVALKNDLTDYLATLPKGVKKAVMSKILTFLPVFVHNYNELELYIAQSLSGCTDMAEKAGCVEILKGLMFDE